MKDNSITYEIKEQIGILSDNGAWALELNLVSWNGAKAKFDLRKWTDDHKKMAKGITFSESEARALLEILDTYFNGEDE